MRADRTAFLGGAADAARCEGVGGAWRRDGTQAGVAVAAWWWRQESEK